MHIIYSHSENILIIKRSPLYHPCINPDLKVYECIHMMVKCGSGTTGIIYSVINPPECLLCARL